MNIRLLERLLVGLGCIAALTGCQSHLLKIVDYSSITYGMTRAEVIAKVGEPDEVRRSKGRWTSRNVLTQESAAMLLTFDANDRVVGIQTSTHFNGPGSQSYRIGPAAEEAAERARAERAGGE